MAFFDVLAALSVFFVSSVQRVVSWHVLYLALLSSQFVLELSQWWLVARWG